MGGRFGKGGVGIALAVLTAMAAACDEGLVEADDGDGGLSGEVLAVDEVGEVGTLAGATVTVTGSEGSTWTTLSGPDGGWSLADLPPDRYQVGYSAEGHAPATLPAVQAPAQGVSATVVRRSTIRILALESAVVDRECGPEPCLDLVLAVSADGLFTDAIRRRVFRGFLGGDGPVNSERFGVTFTAFVTDDDPSVATDGTVTRITLENLRGLDLAGLPAPTGIAVHGATEVSLSGAVLPGEREAFPDLTPSGVTGVLTEAGTGVN